MTIRLFAGFKTSDLGGNVNGAINTNNFSFPAGSYLIPFDAQLWASGSLVSYSGACATLGEILSDASGEIITCYYDNQSNKVVLTASANISVLTFSQTAQRVFGLSSSYSNWDLITGSSNPYFVWTATQGSRAKDSEIFEEDSFVEERLSDSGKAYSVGRVTVAQLRNWEFINEAKENVFDKWANEQSPYTWEKFVKNIRKSGDVFILLEDVSKQLISFEDREGVYALKEESTAFAPKELFPDFIEYWNIPVRTRAYFVKHKDQKLYPPGSVCLLPGIVTPISPQEGELFFIAPEQLVWSSDFDYSGSNPNNYVVYIKKDNPSFTFPQYYPLTKSSQSLGPTHQTGGNWYWRIDSFNQCGSRVGNTFSYKTVGGNVIQPRILTDLNPYLFASGSRQAFSGSYTNHSFDYYSSNELRDIASKINESGNWFIVESEIIQGYPNNNITEWLDESAPTGIVYSEITNSPLNTITGYTAKAVEMIVSGSGVEFNDPWSDASLLLPYYQNTLPFTFSILCKNIPNSKTITGIRIYSTADDYNLYYSIPLTGGIGTLGNNGSSTGANFIVSGSQEFKDSNNETWTYHWFKATISDTFTDNATKIIPCATTGSLTDTWTIPAPSGVDVTCSIGYPQIAYFNTDSTLISNENLVNINAWLPSTASIGLDTFQLTKSVDVVTGAFLSDFVASGSAMKIRLVPSYSSSYSPVDRPIIQFSGSTNGLKFKQSSSFSFFNDTANLRGQIITNSGSYSGSWQLGFNPGEKIDIIVDHDYKRVDWYQSNGYQNHFYFSGGWEKQLGNTFYIGSSGSSIFAFDGLMNVSITSSNPNAPVPPTGSGGIEAELIAESIMWFDAAKGVTLSGSKLDIWNDQSPRGMIASRSAGTVGVDGGDYNINPGYLNDEPVVECNFNTTYDITGSLFDSVGDITQADGLTFYVVMNDKKSSGTTENIFEIGGTITAGGTERRLYKSLKASSRYQVGAADPSNRTWGPSDNLYPYNTGSQCFTWCLTGSTIVAARSEPKLFMFRNRSYWGSQHPFNLVTGSSWINTQGFSLFGRHDAFNDTPTGSFALIMGFTGSHNATKRAQIWDYISNRFGVATEPTTDYAFTSGSVPYSENDFSVIPSSSIDSRLFGPNQHFKIRMIVGSGIYTGTTEIIRIDANQRIIVTTNGSWRYYYQEGTFVTIATTINTDSGLPVEAGDEIEIHIDQIRGNFGILNLTKNNGYNQAILITTSSWAPNDVLWLTANGTSTALPGTGWQVYPPDFGVGFE